MFIILLVMYHIKIDFMN